MKANNKIDVISKLLNLDYSSTLDFVIKIQKLTKPGEWCPSYSNIRDYFIENPEVDRSNLQFISDNVIKQTQKSKNIGKNKKNKAKTKNRINLTPYPDDLGQNIFHRQFLIDKKRKKLISSMPSYIIPKIESVAKFITPKCRCCNNRAMSNSDVCYTCSSK